jgi:hypothetical protein
MNGKSADLAKDKMRELDEARDLRAKQSARLEAAMELVAERRDELQQAAAAAAPDAALDKAEGKVAAAERRVETLQKAIADCDQKIGACEAQLAAILDGNQRLEAARQLEALIADVVESEPQFYAICKKLNEAVALLSPVVPEAHGVDIFLKGALPGNLAELPAALELIVSVARGRVRSILAGHGPAQLPTHPSPAPAPIAAAQPQSAGIYTTKRVKWRDDRGELRTHPAWHDLSLPADLAARAIELGAAVSQQHETAKSSRGAHAFIFPDPAKCVALNDTGEPAPASDTSANGVASPADAQFTPLDRGQPYKIAVPGPVQ